MQLAALDRSTLVGLHESALIAVGRCGRFQHRSTPFLGYGIQCSKMAGIVGQRARHFPIIAREINVAQSAADDTALEERNSIAQA